MLALNQPCPASPTSPSSSCILEKQKIRFADYTERQQGKSETISEYMECLHTAIECPVCLQTFEDCHTSNSCGHSLCRVCTDKVLQTSTSCPVCRVQLNGFVRNYAMDHVVSAVFSRRHTLSSLTRPRFMPPSLHITRTEWGENDGSNGRVMCDVCQVCIPPHTLYQRSMHTFRNRVVSATILCVQCA
jgi:hypothetical protein